MEMANPEVGEGCGKGGISQTEYGSVVEQALFMEEALGSISGISKEG